MSPTRDACLELLRELRTTATLQHAWMVRGWDHERGLQPAAAGLLAEVARRGECRPSELAEWRLVDLSVISRQISQLTEAGLIERRPAPEDGRASLISLSPAGEEELRRWRERHAELMRRALQDWDEEAVSALSAQLRAVNGDLRVAVRADLPSDVDSAGQTELVRGGQ